MIKRLFDIIFSLLSLILFSPILFLFYILIFLGDFKNPIFVQKRFGYKGQEFSFYKLRSMPIGTRNVASNKIDQINITLIGKIIRRANIDELPQLFNILIGDMSFVGPRPCILSQINLINQRKKNNIILLRPGLTGWSQINAYDNMPDEDKIKFDIYYLNHQSFLLDILIIFRTFFFLFKKQPVY